MNKRYWFLTDEALLLPKSRKVRERVRRWVKRQLANPPRPAKRKRRRP